MTAHHIQQELQALSDPSRALVSQRFFKTGPGQYGEGDIFRGISVPVLRGIAKKYRGIAKEEALALLHAPQHEDRLLALLLLLDIYPYDKESIYHVYLAHTHLINNWDLVDTSAPQIVGAYLWKGDCSILYKLAQSPSLWERRIAMISTFFFIRKNEFAHAFAIAEILLHDKHDLIQKAVGWMLREIGKRNQEAEEEFLRAHYANMPRTMLRYAIERFPESLRQFYLK